jgi:hypothetical protein
VAFGVPFCLAAESEEQLVEMRERAPWGTAICDGGDGREFALRQEGGSRYSLSIGGEVVEQHGELKAALDALSRELMVHVAEFAPERVFVHAGVVAWRGCALVLPGASFAGKTTLVAELVRAGATYYSDEYAVLDAEGRVHPYARALSMRPPGEEEQRVLHVIELGGVAGDVPLRAARVVFTEYVAGAQWAPAGVSAGMAALEMLRHAVPVQRVPARVMAALAKMMETATAVRSPRAEAAETAQLLIAMMDEDGTHA